MIGYLDTSVLLRLLLNEPFKKIDLGEYEKIISSEFIEIEARRRLNNMRLAGQLSDSAMANFSVRLSSMLGSIDQILISRPIINRAKHSAGVMIRTLDFIHLCSALFWKEVERRDITILTHDMEFGRAAQTLGLQVVGTASEFLTKSSGA